MFKCVDCGKTIKDKETYKNQRGRCNHHWKLYRKISADFEKQRRSLFS